MNTGPYAGIVENNQDPEKLGRLKIRVPHVYGASGTVHGSIPTDSIPWAIPAGLPAGGSSQSGGFDWLPEPGDQVIVFFLDGEPEKPVWMWMMQTQGQAKNLKLHQYKDQTKAGHTVVGSPARSILTRYGHSLEITPDKVTLTSKEGYQILLEASTSKAGGALKILTPKGQSIRVDDLNEDIVVQGLESMVASAKRVILNAPTSTLIKTNRLTLMAGQCTVTVQENSIFIGTATGASVVVDDTGNIAISSATGATLSLDSVVQLGESTGTGIVIEAGKMSVNAPQFVINTEAFSVGVAAGYPVILMSPAALAWFTAHTHESAAPGSPTGPPLPVFPTDAVSKRMHTS